MTRIKVILGTLCMVLSSAGFSSLAIAQDAATEPATYTFSGDAAVVSKYIWRGQRLTNDWSFQPAMTLGVKGFSFNAWGSVDMTAVNEGDALLLPENPAAPEGARGLQGKFSEIDYTFSYANAYKNVSYSGGTITYTFPDRSASLPSTTEIYGGVSLDSLPLAPSATLYVDVDETTKGNGTNGVYFLLSAGHSLTFNNPIFTGLDLSGSLSFVNNGFSNFFYGVADSGAHDSSITVGLPIQLGDRWSASTFVTYSALLRDFRQHQFQDPRAVYRGTAGSPASYADTVWGGFTLNLSF